jgi:hypothetical protein
MQAPKSDNGQIHIRRLFEPDPERCLIALKVLLSSGKIIADDRGKLETLDPIAGAKENAHEGPSREA